MSVAGESKADVMARIKARKAQRTVRGGMGEMEDEMEAPVEVAPAAPGGRRAVVGEDAKSPREGEGKPIPSPREGQNAGVVAVKKTTKASGAVPPAPPPRNVDLPPTDAPAPPPKLMRPGTAPSLSPRTAVAPVKSPVGIFFFLLFFFVPSCHLTCCRRDPFLQGRRRERVVTFKGFDRREEKISIPLQQQRAPGIQ